ncbi:MULTISPECIES: ion channel [Alteromonadales]|jgi:hypothetical protein|uniref:Potassium channel domain-containing protein n=3 Tax=Salinimonas TaxID=288793 RepID=A0A5B7YIL0_9ALTE|nr:MULTISPECIES: ion channel [Alteromonadales]AXR06606.1 hypothetical protein D0Y50_09630 [Salinimonas sediminis]MBQ53236.1 hypothetical protein [Leeuwenhoekiella sp.]NKX22011.1 hypothetical protein [Alteromonadaceae bacterium A_SAG2]MBD3587702.1 hypothetical protein [Salinimonas profundi]NRA78103.1 hypothetical protein [Pseudoalteromonas sp.]|tara:strand:+ start:1437 stop:1859 length:423 start_codon:yes stop_codon:yes gene_type:complete
MLFAIIISAIALLLSVALHLFNISVVADKFVGKLSKVWTKTQAVVFIAICSQLLLAVIFALAYATGLTLELGGFKQPAAAVDIFYFSLTTITTLGLGSIEPTGHLRMLAGVESATGFLLISCSASKVFMTMSGTCEKPAT